MRSNIVYFIKVDDDDSVDVIKSKLALLLKRSRILDVALKGSRSCIKLHFGEEGNKGFVNPRFLRVICDCLKENQIRCFLCDTNTLYRGRRSNVSDHSALALEHGFTKEIVAAELFIPDDTQKENFVDVAINQRYIKIAKLAKIFFDADSVIGVAHFKGHIMTCFGGAIKNIGMGCASREGKLAQHSDISPVIRAEKCCGCGACLTACPAGAIILNDGKAVIDQKKCIGCASCIAACLKSAIDVDWESGGDVLQEKMIEYAYALLKEKVGKCAFINFATKITKECDCLAKDDPKISPDVGIFASLDPVAVDAATLDTVIKRCGRNVFLEAHPGRDCFKQLELAEKLGLGTKEYEIVEVTL